MLPRTRTLREGHHHGDIHASKDRGVVYFGHGASVWRHKRFPDTITLAVPVERLKARFVVSPV
jgi:hypothetical protein